MVRPDPAARTSVSLIISLGHAIFSWSATPPPPPGHAAGSERLLLLKDKYLTVINTVIRIDEINCYCC